MAKFCPNCGTSCEDNAVFCAGCGNKLAAPAAPQQPVYQAPQQPVYQAPQQPVYQAPQYQAPAAPAAAPAAAGNLADTVKKNIKIIIAVIAAVGLLVGIMNLVGYDVEMSASYGGQSASQDVALSDMREDTPDEAMVYVLSTWVMALAGFAAGGLGAYSLVLLNKNAPGSKKFFSYAALAGTALSVVALVMGLLGGKIKMYGMEATISVHFTYWIAVIVNAAALYIDKGVLKNDYAPLQ